MENHIVCYVQRNRVTDWKRLVHRIENITSNAGKVASPYISTISYEKMGKCSQKDHYFLDNKIS